MQDTAQNEREQLEQYASALKSKVLTTLADLGDNDKALPEMLEWCQTQGQIIVLKDSTILSSKPTSRLVQNCKTVMRHKGIQPGKVSPAVSSLISMVMANAERDRLKAGVSSEAFTEQQQRLRMLVREAVIAKASDIHIEVRTEVARIRFRKHGELYLHAEWLPKLGREIASVAFNKETDHAISHFNPLLPQTASMPLIIDGKDVRLRLASMPAHNGYDVVMRILTAGEEEVPSLIELGYNQEQVDMIIRAVKMPYGAVILSGPTGSGKTTTLASCMSMVDYSRKVYTIEDPVEKVVPAITQVPVNTEHYDRSFGSMGRATLRMDPDVIVLGEMRDEDTALVMVRAAITGHLVFSTLHTNSAPAIVTRLVDMGVSSSLLSDPNLLVCLMCQRLLPKLCPDCKKPIQQSSYHQADFSRLQNLFKDTLNQVYVRGHEDCTSCHGLGIISRTVIAEMIWVDEMSRHYIQQHDVLGWEKYLKEIGWRTFKDQAMDLVKSSLCDPLDAEKLVGELSI